MDLAEAIGLDGYAVVPEVVDDEQRAELIRAIESIRPGGPALDRGGSVYALRDLLRRLPEARRLAESSALRALVEPVLGPKAQAVRGLLFDKRPEANWGVPWHQDLTIAVRRRVDRPGFGPWTVKGGVSHVRPPDTILARMLTIRVHLDEDHHDNGPLRVVPGSHARGRLDAWATRDWLERVRPVACLVPRGGALVMRPLILHASSPAEAPGHRRVLHLEFAAEPLPEPLAWFEDPEEMVG